MSDNEFEQTEEVAASAPMGSDFEVAFSMHADTPLERSFDKAEHWLKSGVKPNDIYLEDRKIGVINFRKVMRDPLLIQAGVDRFIDFRCSLTMSNSDVDAVFSSVCYYDAEDSEPTYINQYDPELNSIKEVLNMVSNNLFTYLQKPLLRTDGN